MFKNGDILEYKDNEVEILRYSKSLKCYIVNYLGKERHISEKVLNKYCTRKR